ncbi:hypothetical protein NDS46_30320 (plasmid) [Paenibacillus thiaminolyticus]|uniref:hypothetical protein n=1 Tax=Paenibacillus thiaminolyticus TaxID=49283 RepID=UPI00232D0DC7|nr:hypothetical protein [Paenibacillus thiaminolyticus]WCF11644.1 hypothetical protein NDS46_30320 [Paenibacillus thiaminolyticus]
MSKSISEFVRNTYFELKAKHNFTCSLTEEKLEENYIMVFDYEKNSIVFDSRNMDELYKQGVEHGVYRDLDFNKFVLFCLLHELGHYYDYKENKKAFEVKSKDEYIQMELNGIQKAKQLVPSEMAYEFHWFNQHILKSYKVGLPD